MTSERAILKETREKLRRCEPNATPYEPPEEPQIEDTPEEVASTDSSEDSKEDEGNEVVENNALGRGNRLRRNVRMPDPNGNLVTHFVKVI